MIGIIADDLTGAAELAGIGIQYGLGGEIWCNYTGTSKTDLLILNTCSRTLNTQQAFAIVKQVTEFLLSLKPDWIFKKTDSVLRGNVVAEISAILEVIGKKKCLLIPVNPKLGRSIVNKEYMIGNNKLTNTSFAQDPDYPTKTSDVLELLGKYGQIRTGYLADKQTIPNSGVFIGETKNESSLDFWAGQINDQVLPAGAAEFFIKLLQKKGYKPSRAQIITDADYGRVLFICGSTHHNSRSAIEQAKKSGASIIFMPQKLLSEFDNNELEKWKKEVCVAYDNSDKIILAVAENKVLSMDTARNIQSAFSSIVGLLMTEIKLHTLIVEGGETAQEIMQDLQIHSFFPKNLLAPGVVELLTRLDNPSTVILKPGSYSWPEFLWSFS